MTDKDENLETFLLLIEQYQDSIDRLLEILHRNTNGSQVAIQKFELESARVLEHIVNQLALLK